MPADEHAGVQHHSRQEASLTLCETERNEDLRSLGRRFVRLSASVDDCIRETPGLGRTARYAERRKSAVPSGVQECPDAASAAWCANRLPRVPRSWRRQPFEVAFEIGVIDLDEIAAFKRIGASLDLRAEGLELEAVSRRHGQRRRRGIFAGSSSPGRGGLPLPARLST